jgi:prepilin-type N-terminal cleavage/methylation domain-containing protein
MRDERGFSLVEVLIALLVLTVVITVSMAAFLERNKRLQQASEITLAYQALANEAEFRRRVPYAQLEGYSPKAFVSIADVDVLAALAPYETEIDVRKIKPDVKNVTMIIRWRDGKRSAQLSVLRADTGRPDRPLETLW